MLCSLSGSAKVVNYEAPLSRFWWTCLQGLKRKSRLVTPHVWGVWCAHKSQVFKGKVVISWETKSEYFSNNLSSQFQKQTGPESSRLPSVRQECLCAPGATHTGPEELTGSWAESRPLPRKPSLLQMANRAGPPEKRTSRHNIITIHRTRLLSWKPVSQKTIAFYSLFFPLISSLKPKFLWSKLPLWTVVYTPNVFQLTTNAFF